MGSRGGLPSNVLPSGHENLLGKAKAQQTKPGRPFGARNVTENAGESAITGVLFHEVPTPN